MMVNTKRIEQVETFRYMGCLVNDTLDPMQEIKKPDRTGEEHVFEAEIAFHFLCLKSEPA